VFRFLPPFILRIWNTAVFWTWMFNGLRFAAGLLLIPLLWRMLSKPDLGLYSLFFQFTGFLLTFDLMFAITISRFVGRSRCYLGDRAPFLQYLRGFGDAPPTPLRRIEPSVSRTQRPRRGDSSKSRKKRGYFA